MFKKIYTIFLAGLLLTGCTADNKKDVTTETTKLPVVESEEVIENKDYIIRILFDDNMNYNYRFGRSFLEILNTYFTEDIGFIQDNDYPAYTNLLRYATNISTKQLAKIYSGGHISDLVNLITKNVECDNVSEFINLLIISNSLFTLYDTSLFKSRFTI